MHIAFFDSGLGGLSVARELFNHQATRQLISQCSYIADTAAYPYGNKEATWLTARISQVMGCAIKQLEPDIVVVACNTASTLALSNLRKQFKLPFVGVVPAIKPAAQLSLGTLGVLATPATVAREYTVQLIADYAPNHRVLLHGANLLVQQAENKLQGLGVDMAIIAQELNALITQPNGAEIDTIVLACTHFPLLKQELISLSPKPIQWVDSGEAIARRVAQIAPEFGLTNKGTPALVNTYFATTGGPLSSHYQTLAPTLCQNYLNTPSRTKPATLVHWLPLHCPLGS